MSPYIPDLEDLFLQGDPYFCLHDANRKLGKGYFPLCGKVHAYIRVKCSISSFSMAEISVHGKRFYPEPMVSFPRLVKPPSPVQYTLPPLMPVTPPPARPVTAPPCLPQSSLPVSVPLPGVPHLAGYMLNNRVSFGVISGELSTDLGISKCRSSKDLIEVAKSYTDELSIPEIGRILDLRDQIFYKGGVFVFTPEQFVQFYSFYNMFLTEERSWDPRLSEKFYNSSRTRLRCSCRWSPRLNKRLRTEDGGADRDCKQKCSACYDMSYWPMHKLVIWECKNPANHSMAINASISNCQYVESMAQRMKTFSAQDIEIMLRAQLTPVSSRLFLELFDSDRIRSLVRSKDDSPKNVKDPDLSADLQMATHLTSQYASPDILSRMVTLKYTRALVLLHKDVFRSMFFSDSVTISTNYKVSLHFDNVSLLTLTTSDGRHGASVFLPFNEMSSQFEELLHMCLRQIEQIGFELYASPSFVGFANFKTINVSLESQTRVERLNGQLDSLKTIWKDALHNYTFQISDTTRFNFEVQDEEVRSLLHSAHNSKSVKDGENQLLDAIALCESRRNSHLEQYVRTQFQQYHKWGPHKRRWSVQVPESCRTCFSGLKEYPFNFRHSMAATALQFTTWVCQTSTIRPKAVPRSKIALSSVLCSPPASDVETCESVRAEAF